MKASAFAYARATSVANALELLAVHGEKARVLSGGQSLIPAMNLRPCADPSCRSPEIIRHCEMRAAARVGCGARSAPRDFP